MPNLNDPADLDNDGNVDELNPYSVALANGTLRAAPVGKAGVDTNGDGILQASKIMTGTYGDNVGETGNVALVGTDTNPIIVQGTVAITNNLAIKGAVKGQGLFLCWTEYLCRRPDKIQECAYGQAEFQLRV